MCARVTVAGLPQEHVQALLDAETQANQRMTALQQENKLLRETLTEIQTSAAMALRPLYGASNHYARHTAATPTGRGTSAEAH